MKTFIFIFLTILSFSVFSVQNQPFLKVKPDNWAYQSIKKLYSEGIIKSNDNFFINNKDKPVTRYQLSLLLARYMEKFPESKSKPEIMKLCANFKTELSMLGFRISKLENNMYALKNDLYDTMLKVERLKNPDLRKNGIKLSIDTRIRFEDLDYKESAVKKVLNENYFVSRTGFDINYSNDNFKGYIRLERDAFFNSQKGDWTNGKTSGNETDTAFYTHYANLIFNAPYKNCDFIILGRQDIKIGSGMLANGVADAYYSEGPLPYFNNIKIHDAAIKMNTSINRPFDLGFLEALSSFKGADISAYYAHQKNPFQSITAEIIDRKTNNIFDGYSGNYSWYGLTANYILFQSIYLGIDISMMDWERDLKVNNSFENGGMGLRTLISYGKNDDLGFDLRYTKFSDYFFAPVGSNKSIIYYFDDPYTKLLYNAAGYTHGFDDLFLELRYPISGNFLLTGRIEDIDDRLPHYGTIDDDRNIYTGIISYKYKPNTRFNLLYRKTNCNKNSSLMPVSGIAGDSKFGYTGNSGAIDQNGFSYNTSDLRELWFEILLNY